MKAKQIFWLAALLVVLAGTAWFVQYRENRGWRHSEEPGAEPTLLSGSFDADAVASMRITADGRSLNFKSGNDGWTLDERDGFPVDMAQLGKIVFDLTETRIAQIVEADDISRKSMKVDAENGAVELTMMDASGKKIAVLAFGKRVEKEADEASMAALNGRAAGTPLGRYVKLEDGRIVLVANTFSILDNDPGQWLEQDFFSVTSLKAAALYRNGILQWRVSREDEKSPLALDAVLPAGFQVAPEALERIKGAFSWMFFKDAAPAGKNGPLEGKIELVDFNGAEYSVEFGKKTAEGRYVHVTALWKGGEGKSETAEKIARLNKRFEKYDFLLVPGALDAVDRTVVQLCREIKPDAENGVK